MRQQQHILGPRAAPLYFEGGDKFVNGASNKFCGRRHKPIWEYARVARPFMEFRTRAYQLLRGVMYRLATIVIWPEKWSAVPLSVQGAEWVHFP